MPIWNLANRDHRFVVVCHFPRCEYATVVKTGLGASRQAHKHAKNNPLHPVSIVDIDDLLNLTVIHTYKTDPLPLGDTPPF